jgi:hypothetical protein
MNNILIVATLLVFTTCNTFTEKTKRTNISLIKYESEIKLPISKNFELYSYFEYRDTEYFCYKLDPWIYIMNLATEKKIDSINTVFEKGQAEKYGVISSFTFSGKDSLFLLFNRAIIFIKNKNVEKVIPINENDTSQYASFRFANLENAPIYFDNKTGEIIGQVYCSVCLQNQKSFYSQKILGGISLETGKLKLYDISYPEMYITNYYGFANHVYVDNYDSLTLISLPCDPKIYFFDRHLNTKNSVWAKSIFQKKYAAPIDTALAKSREEKMRHMVIVPYYTELRYDKNNKLLYRFYLKELDLKNEQGKYNTFNNKQLVLMVLNHKNEVAGEYELDNYYNNFISFVGKKGLYLNYFSRNSEDSDKKVFKILTFK